MRVSCSKLGVCTSHFLVVTSGGRTRTFHFGRKEASNNGENGFFVVKLQVRLCYFLTKSRFFL